MGRVACPRCGRPLAAADRFCRECGARLSGARGPSTPRWIWALALGGVVLAFLLLGRGLLPVEPASAPTSVPATPATTRIAAAPGTVVPVGATPAPTATPRAVFYRADPFGPAKVEPRSTYTVQLGRLEAGTQVRAVVSVTFNNRVSNLSGTPDITVRVTGPCSARDEWPVARNGTQIAFQAAASGDCALVLDNTQSRVNAKQVGIQFLQP